MKKVSVVIPAHNEESNIKTLYSEIEKLIFPIKKYEWEILFIDDGSDDGTLGFIKQLREKDERISYVSLSRNFGKERAMLAGLDYAKGDCAIIMDADLQDPPDLIPEMLKYWEQGFEDVYAKRSSRGKESFLRRRLSMLFYWILEKTTNRETLKNVGDFRLLDRICINALRKMRESERYTKGMYCWIGFKKKEILFDRKDRKEGKSNWNFFSLLNLAIDGITSSTTAPLRISTLLGLSVSLLSFFSMIYFLVKTLIWGDPIQGFPTLIIAMLFLGGVQLIGIGIIGEYIGRIFNETKNRPTYICREYNGEREL